MFLPKKNENKTYTVGLDPSLTSFGIYCLPLSDDAPWYGWVLQTSPSTGSDTCRVLALANSLIGSLSGLDIALASFEDYGPINRTSGKVAQRAELCGILKQYMLSVRRVPIITVPPTSLKAFATGKGNAPKSAMLDSANQLGYYPDTHDEADAFFAARLGARVLLGDTVTPAYTRTNPVP